MESPTPAHLAQFAEMDSEGHPPVEPVRWDSVVRRDVYDAGAFCICFSALFSFSLASAL
jgi:hypothetical protein